LVHVVDWFYFIFRLVTSFISFGFVVPM